MSYLLATFCAAALYVWATFAVVVSPTAPKISERNTINISFPALHPGAAMVEAEADAFLKANNNVGRFVLAGHRGWNKTSFALRRILRFVRNTKMPAAWYAPTLKPITDAWENLFKKALGPKLFDQYMNRSEMILRIPDCGSIHFYSLVESGNAAGPTYPFMVFDEAGAQEDGVWEAILDPIVEKAITSYEYAEAWQIGTPNREGNPHNDFWQTLMGALSGENPDWKGWHIPLPAKVHGDGLVAMDSPYAHPAYTFQRADRAYRRSKRKKKWRIEWLCEFISDDGGQFEADAIESQCCLMAVQKMIPIKDTSFYRSVRNIGADYADDSFKCWMLQGHTPSGAGNYQKAADIGVTDDSTSIGVLDKDTMRMVFLLHFLPHGKDRWFLIREALALVDRMYPGRFLVDTTGAGSNLPEDMATQYGIGIERFVWSEKDETKEPVYGKAIKDYVHDKEGTMNHASELLEGGLLWLFNLDYPVKKQLDLIVRVAKVSGKGYTIKAKGKNNDDFATMLGQLCLDVNPDVPETEQNENWSVGSTASSILLGSEEAVITVLDEMEYHNAYLTSYAG